MRWIYLVLATFLFGGCETDYSPPTPQPDMSEDMEEDSDPDVLTLRTITPTQGNVEGGTVVTLTGRAFETGVTVTFGETEATNVVVESATRARATSPAGIEGPVDVTVTLGDEFDTLSQAFTYVSEVDPTVGFCRLQAQSPTSTTLAEETEVLYAIVFAEGITQGEGQGPGIIGEMGWGRGLEVAQYTYNPMAYNVDIDGLSEGDRSNDEYGAALTIPTTGDFNYVARFRTESSSTWIYCDLDGSENGIQEDQLGVVSIAEPSLPQISYCQLQAQSPASGTTGEASETLFALVFAEGVTQGAGQGSGVEGELGWGTPGAQTGDFNWKTMTYNLDVDGLTPGDAANDEYGTTLTLSTAGTFDYLARFRLNDGAWVYCDLNGIGADSRGVIEVTDPAQAQVGFCQTRPASLQVETGQMSAEIEGVVFVAGATSGANQGTGIQTELRWGPIGDAPTTWTNSVIPAYAGDEDGLVPGDLANDRYTATITATTAGEYGYAYRFSTDGGTNWTYCDTSGAPPFEATEVGTLTVQDVVVNYPQSCRLQFPEILNSVLVGDSVTLYGRVTEPGVTGSGQASAQVQGELLVGLQGENPVTNPAAFQVIQASVRNLADVVNPGADQDEYEAVWSPSAAGSYTFAYRFSVDQGQNFAYCDLDGSTDGAGFDTRKLGAAQVSSAPAPELVSYCNVWQATLSASLANDAPVVTVETFSGGLTDSGNFNGSEIEAEVGYGAVGLNPALPGNFTWQAMAYKGPRPGAPNNQEYENGVYANNAKPGAGDYSVAVRVRPAGQSAWAYCDTNNGTMDFFTLSMTSLTVAP